MKECNNRSYSDFNTILSERVSIENPLVLHEFDNCVDGSSTDSGTSSNDSVVTLYSFMDTDEDMDKKWNQVWEQEREKYNKENSIKIIIKKIFCL